MDLINLTDDIAVICTVDVKGDARLTVTNKGVKQISDVGLRLLDSANKFDAQEMARGAVGVIGYGPTKQLLSQGSYDKVAALVKKVAPNHGVQRAKEHAEFMTLVEEDAKFEAWLGRNDEL